MTREEAIANINMLRNEYNDQYIDYCGINEAVNMAIEALEAEPIKHGRWKVNNETEEWVTIYCDQCHDGMWNRKGDPYPNYCFNCGARMDGEENG